MESLASIATLVTFFALIVAIWQSREAWLQTRALRDIYGSLSTRYIGPYPDFLSTIVQFLESTTTTLTIVVDCPHYAGFSFPDEALRCTQAIEILLNKPNVKLRFITRTSDQRRSATKHQFPFDSAGWKEWRSRPETQERLTRLIGVSSTLSTLSYDEFEDALEAQDSDTLARFNKAVKAARGHIHVMEVEKPLPMNFWIVDGKKAVFALVSYSSDTTEYGFETSDARLIAALEGIAEDLVRTSQRKSTV